MFKPNRSNQLFGQLPVKKLVKLQPQYDTELQEVEKEPLQLVMKKGKTKKMFQAN